jgi:hypothetical protein
MWTHRTLFDTAIQIREQAFLDSKCWLPVCFETALLAVVSAGMAEENAVAQGL